MISIISRSENQKKRELEDVGSRVKKEVGEMKRRSWREKEKAEEKFERLR